MHGGAHPQSVPEAVVQIADRNGRDGSLPSRWVLIALYVQQSSQSMDALGQMEGRACRATARSYAAHRWRGGTAPAAVRTEGDDPDGRRCKHAVERDTTRLPL